MEQHQKARKQMVILSSVSVAAGIHAGLDESMRHLPRAYPRCQLSKKSGSR